MAFKLERAFGADADSLIRRQAELETESADGCRDISPRQAHSAGYLTITSTDIAHWAETTAARTRLPVLMRRLAQADTNASARINFPGHDAGERKGWDGITETEAPGRWVAGGKTGWEL